MQPFKDKLGQPTQWTFGSVQEAVRISGCPPTSRGPVTGQKVLYLRNKHNRGNPPVRCARPCHPQLCSKRPRPTGPGCASSSRAEKRSPRLHQIHASPNTCTWTTGHSSWLSCSGSQAICRAQGLWVSGGARCGAASASRKASDSAGARTGHPRLGRGALRPAPLGRAPLPITLLGHRRRPAGSAPPSAPDPWAGRTAPDRPHPAAAPRSAYRLPSSRSESCRRPGLSREGHAGRASVPPATSEEKSRAAGVKPARHGAAAAPPRGPRRTLQALGLRPPLAGGDGGGSSFPSPAPHHPETEIRALAEPRRLNQLPLGTSPEIL